MKNLNTLLFLGLSFFCSNVQALVHDYTVRSHDDKYNLPGYFVEYEGIANSEKLPTIYHVHGGPQEFLDSKEDLEGMAKTLECHIVAMSYRGDMTNFSSDDYAEWSKNELDYGGKHIQDIITAVEYTTNTFKDKIDPEKRIISGHSFGGYSTAVIATSPMAQYFKLAISYSGFYKLGEYASYNAQGDDNDLNIQRRRDLTKFTQFLHIPIGIVHGGSTDKTTLVSPEGAEEFVKNAQENDKQINFLKLGDEGHVYTPKGEEEAAIFTIKLIKSFLYK